MILEATDREYETIYVLKPDAAREVTEAIATRVSDVIKAGGKVTQVENWGRRKLAYAVSKYKRGVYVYFKYVGGGTMVAELERTLRLQESVMKFQTVKTDASASVAADEASTTFEHIEELDGEEDETLAQELGLDLSSRIRPSRTYSDDQPAKEGDAEGDAEPAAAAEASAEPAAAEPPAAAEGADTKTGGNDQ